MMEGWLEVAVVARPHGVRGALRLHLHNPASEVLLRAPAPRVALRMPDGSRRDAEIVSARPVPGGLLVELGGVGDRDAAEALRRAAIEVPRSELEPPGAGEYFAADLVGCEVRLGERRLGVVRAVAPYPTCDALVVARDRGTLEVPMLASFVAGIDLGARVVTLHTIDGLE
jgi:16S rRNA processing protein RimM